MKKKKNFEISKKDQSKNLGKFYENYYKLNNYIHYILWIYDNGSCFLSMRARFAAICSDTQFED